MPHGEDINIVFSTCSVLK